MMVNLWSKIVGNLRALIGRAPSAETCSGTDTEFTAEIVRIAEILPHPNADRLELARFELRRSGLASYEVVIQKGTYSAGDLAAYFSVDCVVPTAHPDFAFLKTRMDGSGKDFFRLRAARLRGVFSQGLLVPAPTGFAFGADVAAHFGVTYHRGPEDSTPGTPTAAKRKPQPWTIYGVDSLRKLPRLFGLGEEVIVTEKIHGCNMRFGWVRRRFMGIPCGWKFLVGSHRAMKGEQSRGAGYYGDDVWAQAAEKMRLREATKDYKGYLFVGELYGYTYTGKAIQDLTYGRDATSGPGLLMFDVKDPRGCWLPWYARQWVLEDCNLKGVPVLARGSFAPEMVGLAEGQTTVWDNPRINVSYAASGVLHIREGVVIETLDRKEKAKYVGTGYLLRKEG